MTSGSPAPGPQNNGLGQSLSPDADWRPLPSVGFCLQNVSCTSGPAPTCPAHPLRRDRPCYLVAPGPPATGPSCRGPALLHADPGPVCANRLGPLPSLASKHRSARSCCPHPASAWHARAWHQPSHEWPWAQPTGEVSSPSPKIPVNRACPPAWSVCLRGQQGQSPDRPWPREQWLCLCSNTVDVYKINLLREQINQIWSFRDSVSPAASRWASGGPPGHAKSGPPTSLPVLETRSRESQGLEQLGAWPVLHPLALSLPGAQSLRRPGRGRSHLVRLPALWEGSGLENTGPRPPHRQPRVRPWEDPGALHSPGLSAGFTRPTSLIH